MSAAFALDRRTELFQDLFMVQLFELWLKEEFSSEISR